MRFGAGGFGTVYKSKLKTTGKIVACKVISHDMNKMVILKLLGIADPETLYNSYVKELNAYNELKGENILKMIGSCEVKKPGENTYDFMILTEFMEKGSLAKCLKDEGEHLSFRRRLEMATDDDPSNSEAALQLNTKVSESTSQENL
jgi:serine/threonine protein kinase